MEKNKSRYQKDEIEFLVKNVNYYGIDVCADKLGRGKRALERKVIRLLGDGKYKCKATKDEIDKLEFVKEFKDFTLDFAKTNSPKELAYFLGYFWADGTVQPGHGYVIEILKNDADCVRNIFNKIATFYEYTRKRENRQEQTTFRLPTHNETTDTFKFLGKYPNSTEGFEKIISFIPKDYLVYFIRGFFDGDGCIYTSFNKSISIQITFCGRYEQDWSYLLEVFEKYGLQCKIKFQKQGKNKSSVIISSNPIQIRKFLSEIYKENDGIFLKRKYEKIKRILENETLNTLPLKDRNKIEREYKVIKLKTGENYLILSLDAKNLQNVKVGDTIMNSFGEIDNISEIIYDDELNQNIYITTLGKKYLTNEIIGNVYKKNIRIIDSDVDIF